MRLIPQRVCRQRRWAGKDGRCASWCVSIIIAIACCVCPLEAGKAIAHHAIGRAHRRDEALRRYRALSTTSERSGNTLVRADVTYWRQDFSLCNRFFDHGKWSLTQRFDYLVRTRELTGWEMASHRPASRITRNHRHTLRALTGKSAPRPPGVARVLASVKKLFKTLRLRFRLVCLISLKRKRRR